MQFCLVSVLLCNAAWAEDAAPAVSAAGAATLAAEERKEEELFRAQIDRLDAIQRFKLYAPELRRKHFAADVSLAVTIERHPEVPIRGGPLSVGVLLMAPEPSALQAEPRAPFPLSTLRAKFITLLNAMPTAPRERLQMGAIRSASAVDQGKFTIVTEPVGSKDGNWCYQRYVRITVDRERPYPNSPYYNVKITTVVQRRKGAENFSAKFTQEQSGEAEDQLLEYLRTTVP